MVEEQIADDIENVHTAVPADFKRDLPRVDTAIVEHRQLVEWLDLLHTHRLSPSALLIDALCLPPAHNGMTLLVEKSRLVIRQSAHRGVAVPVADAALLLPSLLQSGEVPALDSGAPRQIALVYSEQEPEAAAVAEDIQQTLMRYCPDDDIKLSVYREPAPELLAADWRRQLEKGINLLQGGYAIASQRGNDGFRWGRVAGIAAIGIALYLAVAAGGGWYFHNRADGLEQQSVALYRQLYPNERRVINPRKQMSNQLRTAGPVGNSSFLALLAETASRMDGSNDTGDVSVNEIRFDRRQGELRFELVSGSLDQLDRLKNQLAAGGLRADINSASEQDNTITGRIVVSPL